MKVNVFEGARRIIFLIQAAIVLIGGYFVYEDASNDYYRSIIFVSEHPNQSFYLTKTECGYDDLEERKTVKMSNGDEVNIDLCFRSVLFDSGDKLVPYKIDKKGMTWGASKYSPVVEDYASKRKNEFKLKASEEKLIESELTRQFWKELKDGGQSIVIACIAVWIVSGVLGWVIRGFLGIPSGRDSRLINDAD